MKCPKAFPKPTSHPLGILIAEEEKEEQGCEVWRWGEEKQELGVGGGGGVRFLLFTYS